MKTIPLTQNQFAMVDDHWFDYLNQWKWYARWDKTTLSYYASRYNGKEKRIHMHNVVAKTPGGMKCDHRNHNTLENTEENLRNATPSQSAINRKVFKNNSLGIKGVAKQTHCNSYKAYLNIDGERVFDKTFKTIEEAVQARRDAEKKYFGKFAYKQEVK